MCFCTETIQVSQGVLLQFLDLQIFWSLENCKSNNKEKKKTQTSAVLESGLGVYGEEKQSRQ